ncbi:hypothetical protein ACFYT4_00870 [Streptomyces sp. NPDC004609]|uniref:hypothetical protein n=1 Tax=Streptomyces sp. NPDC004609 TaxID=3364704 RepID=UPI0036CD35A0
MDQLLEAGAVLPLGADAGAESAGGAGGGETGGGRTGRGASAGRARKRAAGGKGAGDAARGDRLTARAYVHPALDGRTVVRLVPEAIGPAEDLALEYLGFGTGESVPVGRVKRQSLGFPAWALVNDPKHGHHALAVVKEMERLTRLVATKPGLAKEGFDEIGDRLDRSVPQFLPTYYEQVARLFLAVESQQQASVFFGKARAAEQRHALPVDEERLREVFLEFAGAGALSGKALREHAKGLGDRLGPERAYAEFRVVTSQRCSAGLTPYAGMLEDLRRLARSAGLDSAAEERELIREIIPTGVMSRASGSFWKSALPALAQVAAEDRSVRERLLGLLPSAGGDSPEEFDESWLALLDRCGAIELLEDGTVPAADWLSGWCVHRQRGWRDTKRVPAELALVERLADRLIADGTPVRLVRPGRRGSVDLNLLDLCLSLGVPVETPPDDVAALDLTVWLHSPEEGRRDLAALAGDPRFARVLRAGVEGVAQGGDAQTRLMRVAEHPALRTALVGWLSDRADDLTRPMALPGVDRLLRRLLVAGFPPVLATAPDALERIASFSPAGALARTLRAGVLDELGWSALEEGLKGLGDPDPKAATHVNSHGDSGWYGLSDAWPGLIVRLGMQALVVGPDRVLDRLTISLPAARKHTWDTPHIRYIDGQWLTVSGVGDDRRARWSGREAEVFRPDGTLPENWVSQQTPSLQLPDGSRTFGSRPVRPGDTSFAGEWRAVASDGISVWVLHEGAWWDYDPQSARRGRISVPSFFDSALAEGGGTLLERYCRMLPAQPGLESSPFGSKDGLVGWWVRFDPGTHTVTACSVDGSRSPALPVPAKAGPRYLSDGIPMPPMRLPGGAVLHPRESRGYEAKIEFHDSDGMLLSSVTEGGLGGVYAAGTPVVPPVGYWHALRPRDEEGSTALRGVTAEDAQALVTAVVEGAKPEDAVRSLLPAITHPGLVAGVAGLVGAAAHQAGRVTRLAEWAEQGRQASASSAADRAVAHAHDGRLRNALSGLTDRHHHGGYSWEQHATTAMGQLHALRDVLAPDADGSKVDLTGTGVAWQALPGAGVAATAVRAAAPVVTEAEREVLLEFLDAVLAVRAGGEAILADPRGRLRTVHLKARKVDEFTSMLGEVRHAGARRLLFTAYRYGGDNHAHWDCLEYDPAGAFGAWKGFTEVESTVMGSPGDPVRADAVRRMVDAVRERGPLPYRPEQVGEFAGPAGVSGAVAALLLLGLPGVDGYGREGLLPAEYLAPLGLGTPDAKAGRGILQQLPGAERRHYVGLLLPGPDRVDGLWADGFDLEPLAGAWVAARGKQRVAPSWLVARAVAETGPGVLLDKALNPESQPELTGRTTQRLDDGDELVPAEREKLLTGSDVAGYVGMMRWLAYRLPFGDPLRAILPVTLRALRERLADPGLLIDLGVDWDESGKGTSARLRETAGLARRDKAEEGIVELSDALVLAPMRYYSGWDSVWVRTSAVVAGDGAGPDHPALKLLVAVAGEKKCLKELRTLLSAEFEALVSADGPPGAAQSPAHSVPGLVTAARERFGLGEDAACLYLTLLALPDPTDRNQAEWTGWKPARLKKARAELAATDLVVEAKRARAGRSLFLPGGWLETKSPRLPVESWKTSLLPWETDGFVVPDRPVAELFATAWQRVTDGDAPGFEEFKGRGGRHARGGSR